MNKIKGRIGVDSYTLVCLLVIVLVGLGSFGLGRLSVLETQEEQGLILGNESTTFVKEEIGENMKEESNMKSIVGDVEKVSDTGRQRMYVASKNGKLYYPTGCSGAKRISIKNEVWFASKTEAEKAGYELASSCK